MRHFNDWLSAFVEYGSIGEAPEHTLLWTGISTVAGALRRRVWIDQVHFQWTPNFYVVIVAPPEIVAKSTTASIGISLLKSVEDVEVGPEGSTWQALLDFIERNSIEVPEIINPDGSIYTTSSVTCAFSELGTFLNPEDSEQIMWLIRLWDSPQENLSRLTRHSGSNSIENPWFNFIACTTPNWLNQNMPEHMLEGGFFSRCIFIWATEKARLVPYVSQTLTNKHLETKRMLVEDLQEIAKNFGKCKLTPEAFDYGSKHYIDYWRKRMDATGSAKYTSSYIRRMQTHLHKLAIVLAASDNSLPTIEARHLERANELLQERKADMQKALSLVGASKLSSAASNIVDFVLSINRPISQNDLFRKFFFRKLTLREFEEALKSALTTKQIVKGEIDGQNYLASKNFFDDRS